TLCLLGGMLIPAQVLPPGGPSQGGPPRSLQAERPAGPAFGGEWLLTPRLVIGQELVYRGTYTEQASGAHVQLQRGYRLENRAFVLESGPRGLDVAVLTLLRDQTVAGTPAGD